MFGGKVVILFLKCFPYSVRCSAYILIISKIIVYFDHLVINFSSRLCMLAMHFALINLFLSNEMKFLGCSL